MSPKEIRHFFRPT